MNNDSPSPLESQTSSDRAEAIFNGALQLPSEQRAIYIKQASGDDEPLRQQVESLLKSNDEAGEFLEESPRATPNKTIALEIPPTEKAGDRIGRYKLLQPIGEGGCGVVYMAEQEEPVRRRVALKVIKLGMDTKQVVARFEAERQALALMDHPNIAKVLDAGATDTGRPFFVMELVRGIKITEYCDQNKLSTEERLKLFMQVCHALQHAHQKGIIHRDIKPSNILVTVNDNVPIPKVIDFGIAKATEQRLTDKTVFTAFEQFIGTPAYMSPEQAVMTSLDIDTRTDIYSLGVLLYELLTGQTPFDAKKLLASGLDHLRKTIREEEPQRPSTRLQTMLAMDSSATASHCRMDTPKLIHLLRGDLDWIVMKALEKDRTRRYETASGFAMDVERYLKSEPITARPPSTLYRFQKMVRRNKAIFAAVGTGVAALIVGLALSLYLFVQERDAHRRAVAAEKEQSRLREKAERTAALEAEMRRGAEMSQNVGMAAFLLTQDKWEEAERAINKVPLSALPHIITNYPATAAIFNWVGEKHARRGQFLEAITNFSRVAEAFPSDNTVFHQLAPLLTQVGDTNAFLRYAQNVLAGFAGDPDPAIPAILARDSLLLPLPPPLLDRIHQLADTALAADVKGGSPDVPFAEGMVEYRLGNYSKAAEWLQKYIARDASRYHNMRGLLVLAMTQFHLGQLEPAKETFADALDYTRRKLPKPGDDEFSSDWNDALDVHVLLREAKALFAESSAPASQAK